MFKKSRDLIVDVHQLPQEVKAMVRRKFAEYYGPDRYIEFYSEFQPFGPENTWAETLTMDGIRDYWQDQVDTNGFKGNLDAFIREYFLELEVWFIEQKVDLTDIDNILFKIG